MAASDPCTVAKGLPPVALELLRQPGEARGASGGDMGASSTRLRAGGAELRVRVCPAPAVLPRKPRLHAQAQQDAGRCSVRCSSPSTSCPLH